MNENRFRLLVVGLLGAVMLLSATSAVLSWRAMTKAKDADVDAYLARGQAEIISADLTSLRGDIKHIEQDLCEIDKQVSILSLQDQRHPMDLTALITKPCR